MNRSQKLAVASSLAVQNLRGVLLHLEQNAPVEIKADAIAFAKKIDRYYRKRDGFIPRPVIRLCNT